MVDYIIIVILIAFSACFSSMETAFSTVNKIRLRHQAANGDKRAEKALKIADNFDKTITTILIGNNIVNIFSASLATLICTRLFEESLGTATATAISTASMTIIVLIFGEILPKSLAKQNAERFALTFASLMSFFNLVLTPVSTIFMFIQKAATKLFKSADAPSVTEDELKYIIEEIEDEGVLEEKESELVRSALEFDETRIEEILVPRVKIVAVEQDDDVESIKEIFLKERYSRLPVYDKNIDNIVGILNEKDFFALYTQNGVKPNSVTSIIQKALYISEMKPISEVLYEMQRTKIHMAIVKDQYGGTSGLVTLEDIIEELVGEIYDENDEIIQSVVSVGENMYEIMADLSLSDMLEKLELPEDIIKSESNTVGGWVMELFDCIPEKNASVKDGIFTVTVIDSDDQSVSRIGLKIMRNA
ncbi:MAG: HlyC/CorC family transporter [Oscillospiraceae bacterium]|nr:HlyC/CorC family transporter [Oscillospiraceae bacterium]